MVRRRKKEGCRRKEGCGLGENSRCLSRPVRDSMARPPLPLPLEELPPDIVARGSGCRLQWGLDGMDGWGGGVIRRCDNFVVRERGGAEKEDDQKLRVENPGWLEGRDLRRVSKTRRLSITLEVHCRFVVMVNTGGLAGMNVASTSTQSVQVKWTPCSTSSSPSQMG